MTGRVQAPALTAPTTQVQQPQAQTFQASNYGYTPQQFSATQSSGAVSVAKPQGSPYGPTFMQRPVQGYQTPARTVDYSYKPQYQAPRQIQSPQWAVPKLPVQQIPGVYNAGDIDYNPPSESYNADGQQNPNARIYDADGNQIGGPRFNTDGAYMGSWESGLSDGT